MAPAAQRAEKGVGRDLGHEVAGAPADRAEGRGPGPRGAGSALVVVAVAHNPNAITLLEGIVQQPFEGAPGRVHLDTRLEPAVVRGFDVGVTAADMGDDHRVFTLERAEELIRRVDRAARGLSLD